jgi:DNA-binding Lrp family transcriptional regulator
LGIELDRIDLELLSLLQQDARTPQATLSKKVGLSTAAVNRRIARLTNEKVISRTSAVLSQESLGYPLSLVVLIEVESEQPEQLDKVKHSFNACPNIQQNYYVTGEWDFVLMVCVQDMAQYISLTRDLFLSKNNVKRFKTLVVMDSAKVSLDVPLISS